MGLSGMAEMAAELARVQAQMVTAGDKEKKAARQAADLGKVQSCMQRCIDNEAALIRGTLRMVRDDLAGIPYAKRFREKFESDVRAILEGAEVKSALSSMESAAYAVKKDRNAAENAVLSNRNRLKSLKAEESSLKRKIQALKQMGVQS